MNLANFNFCASFECFPNVTNIIRAVKNKLLDKFSGLGSVSEGEGQIMIWDGTLLHIEGIGGERW